MERIKKVLPALRVTATLHLVAVFAQAVLAGLFVTGDVDMLVVHSALGGALALLAIVQLVVAILVRRRGGPARVVRNATGLLVMDIVQIALGAARLVALHIPFGVLIFGGSLMLTTTVWRFRPQDAAVPEPAGEKAVTA